MKNVMMSLTIAAAAFMAVAGAASAQTMEAKIPFAFRVSGKVLAAGTYHVSMLRSASGNPTILIRGADPAQEALAIGYSKGNAKKAWTAAGNAVVSFECGVSRCALHELWMGGGAPAYSVPVPSLGRDEPKRTAQVVMHQVKAD